MKVGEFARRARVSRLGKKATAEAAFERARRDLNLPEPRLAPSPTPGFEPRRNASRANLILFRQAQEQQQQQRRLPQLASRNA